MPTRREFLNTTAALVASSSLLETVSAQQQTNASEVFADFESGTYDGWKLSGNCWTPEPASDVLFPGKITGFEGKRFLCTLHPKLGTAATGKAVSKEFTIEKPFINFLIGGGSYPNQACLNLLVDGKVVRTETGNDSAHLSPAYWDVYAFMGKTAHLEVIDATTNLARGYVMVDDIHLTDLPDTFLQTQLPAMTEKIRLKYELPAIFVAVGYAGRIFALYAGGKRRIDKEVPVTLNDRVMIGSITKSCTAIVVGNLVAKGVIRPDTTVGGTLPELRESMDPAYRNTTVWPLLKHTAGLAHHAAFQEASIKSSSKWRYESVSHLLRLPPIVPVGQYSCKRLIFATFSGGP